jgi:putative ABC transport system permease protein
MQTVWQDIHYGLRTMAKNPGFTAVALITLALGIGANAGIFSVMRQVLLQRLPVPHAAELVLLYGPGPTRGHVSSDEGDGSESFSYPMYTDLRDHNAVFAGLAAKADFPVSVAFRGQTERADADVTSGNYFDVLGVRAVLGRTFQASDTAAPGSNPVLMLGYGYWKKRFGGDEGLLNQSILVNNQPMTVVGVVQAGFDGIQLGRIPDVYLPITMKSVITPNWNGLNDHQDYWVKLIGRLRPGVSQEQAEAGIAPTYHALIQNELALNKGFSEQEKTEFLAKRIVIKDGTRGRPLLENDTRPQLLTLMGMVALVLLIACANVAGLLTARGAARQREIGLRLSLGATRWRLVRQLVIESCLLSLLGASLGLVIASWVSNGLVHYAAVNDVADGLSGALGAPVLLFASGLAIACGVLFGVAPALRATRVELARTLKEQGGALASGVAHARLRKGLVVSQVALTLLLVTSAGGFLRSFYNLQHVDLGLEPAHVLQFSIAPELNGYTNERSVEFYRQLEERLLALPGVRSLSGTMEPLIANSDRGSNITVEGESATEAGTRHVMRNGVGPGHFANLGIPLLEGREFTRKDGPGSPKVAIVNETMVKSFFPQGEAVGRRMKFGAGSDPLNLEIVGVVRDSHHSDVNEKTKAFVYLPYSQEKAVGSLTYYLRSRQDPRALGSSVRKAVAELDASLPVYGERTFEEQVRRRLSGNRLVAVLATAFGALAAVLAATGIYGLLAYTVTQRTREIGVRMALGAAPRRVGGMILKEVARLVGIGVSLGLPLAYGFGKAVNSLLYGVKAFEASSVGIALVTLGVVSIAAGYFPVRRATRVDPLVALRYE